MRYLALVCILLAPQDAADKVRALVEKLGSEDIETRDGAQAELTKLGPSALPALRKHLDSAEGEVKARLEAVIPKLERAGKLAPFLAPGPTITLKAKDRPAFEVIAEISKQAQVPVDGAALPAGTLVSLDADRMSFPAAIDEVCRRHGGIMHQWSETRVRLLPAPYRPRRIFSAGSFHFMPDGFLWSLTRGREEWSSFRLYGLLVGPPGRLPQEMKVMFESVIDDNGTDLGVSSGKRDLTLGELEWPRDRKFCRMVNEWTTVAPAPAATKLKTCRGALRLSIILEGRKLLSREVSSTTESFHDGPSLHVSSCVLNGRRLQFHYSVSIPDEEGKPARLVGPTWLALHDKSGRRLEGREQAGPAFAGGGFHATGDATFDLPEGFEPVSIDLMEATDFEEVRIPFDLGEVRLK